MRDKYYKEFIDSYFSEFSSLLKVLGVNAETSFPRSALNEQLMKVGRYGISLSLFAIDALTTIEIPDLNDMAEQLKADRSNGMNKEETNEKFNNWMSETIRDAFEYGLMQYTNFD